MSLYSLAPFTDWITTNLNNIIFSVVMVVAGYVIYRLLSRQIRSFSYNKRLEKHLALTLIRVVKWLSALIIFSAILAQWGVTLGTIMTIVTIFGGTIIGFAAVNTIGNAIAGLIVMTSRPFAVGDRIFFNGKFADVIAIELIYTKMFTLDNVLVSVPNQELLKAEVDNYGKENVIRRRCTVTPGFEYDSAEVEKALLEAAEKTPDVLKDPKPYVWITNFQNYAVEYSLYVFISEIKRLPEIDAELYRQVLEACKRHEIDISTPTLLKQIKS
jgi:small-conductance mechanosensitive channel